MHFHLTPELIMVVLCYFILYVRGYIERSRTWVNVGSNQKRNNILTLHDTIRVRGIEVSCITSESMLLHAVNELETCKEICIDLEFDRERYSYGFNLCLVQIFGNDKCYIFDPLSVPDLGPLFNILEDPNVLKIFHAPSEDLRLLHTFDCFPRNIFDTETCAKLLNASHTALSVLLSNYLNIDVDKSLQKSNWMKRPLTNLQLQYAAQDVIHLIALRDGLTSHAHEVGVVDWVDEENRAWESFRTNTKDPLVFTNREDSRRLDKYSLYVLNDLLAVRDKYAQLKNKPGGHIISKDVLIDLMGSGLSVRKFLSQNSGYHPIMKTEAATKDFQTALDRAVSVAEKNREDDETALQSEMEAAGFTTLSEYKTARRAQANQETELIQNIIRQKYSPVIDVIVERYGQITANYLLNKNTLTMLAKGELLFQDIPQSYRRELFSSIIQELGLDPW